MGNKAREFRASSRDGRRKKRRKRRTTSFTGYLFYQSRQRERRGEERRLVLLETEYIGERERGEGRGEVGKVKGGTEGGAREGRRG